MSTPSSSASSAGAEGFSLHPTLEADCHVVGDLPVCHVLLMDNQRFPWLILVPRRTNLRELTDLSDDDYTSVACEIRQVSSQFSALTGAHKMNIAALGNMVPQLHIHLIARYRHDPAWPQPVWNSGISGESYSESACRELLHECRLAMGLS